MGHSPNLTINNSWTNFLDCVKRRKKVSTINPDIAHHMPKITLISTVGYSISLVFLLVATVLMVGLKKLHCQRNTIHINLFLSFIFRAAVSLVRNGALVKGFAFSWDFDYDADGTVVFNEDKSHWECKILNVLHQYALEANYTWIFVEGLYLHTLIFFAVFSQTKKFFKVYIIIGWSIPLIFVITWVLLRIYKNDVLCWNTHKKNYYWVLEAPIIASITVNFFFFLNIIRVLFTKIRNCNSRDPRRFRKLAKSTLVLIPLFGVYYIIFIILARHKSPDIAIVHLYLEMTLNSFQGIVVAFLFCFLNEEVRLEVKKKWNRHMLSRRYSSSSRRSSHAFSTSSFILRERFSLSHTGSPVNDNNGKNHLTNLDRPIFDNSGDKIETKPIPRVPSESKVTFNLLNNIEHQNGSPLPKEYKPRNNIIKKETVPTVTEDSENHSYPPLCDEDLGVEFELLIPEKGLEDDNLIQESCSLSLSNTDDSRNKYNGVAQKSLTRSHSSSPAISPTSNTFPSSNGLSLVKDPTYLLQQMKAKDI